MIIGVSQADLAQLVEHLICNQGVTGSSPVIGTISPSVETLGITSTWSRLTCGVAQDGNAGIHIAKHYCSRRYSGPLANIHTGRDNRTRPNHDSLPYPTVRCKCGSWPDCRKGFQHRVMANGRCTVHGDKIIKFHLAAKGGAGVYVDSTTFEYAA